jgi:hypothetical protein
VALNYGGVLVKCVLCIFLCFGLVLLLFCVGCTAFLCWLYCVFGLGLLRFVLVVLRFCVGCTTFGVLSFCVEIGRSSCRERV